MNIYNSLAKKKEAISICTLKNGIGKILINKNKPFLTYFISLNELAKNKFNYPFKILNLDFKLFDISFKVNGGGLSSQLEASIFAVVKILAKLNLLYKEKLHFYNLLKFDNRKVERKKYGLKKARKATQYSKR
jgi:small subunit ribosomal protein S9